MLSRLRHISVSSVNPNIQSVSLSPRPLRSELIGLDCVGIGKVVTDRAYIDMRFITVFKIILIRPISKNVYKSTNYRRSLIRYNKYYSFS